MHLIVSTPLVGEQIKIQILRLRMDPNTALPRYVHHGCATSGFSRSYTQTVRQALSGTQASIFVRAPHPSRADEVIE